jgi:membrane-associated phospholipid phosphatase
LSFVRLLALGLLVATAAPAQPTAPAADARASCGRFACDSLALERDVHLLLAAYGNPRGSAALGLVDDLSYATFVLLPLAASGDGLAGNGDLRPAVRLGASQALGALLVLGAKQIQARPRPFASGLVARRGSVLDSLALTIDRGSFPSGHATLAFAAATSIALDAGRWYVTLPVLAWAGAVGWARVRQGVHYPSDVLGGAALGFTAAAVVRVLLPDGLGRDAPLFGIAVRL